MDVPLVSTGNIQVDLYRSSLAYHLKQISQYTTSSYTIIKYIWIYIYTYINYIYIYIHRPILILPGFHADEDFPLDRLYFRSLLDLHHAHSSEAAQGHAPHLLDGLVVGPWRRRRRGSLVGRSLGAVDSGCCRR